jgi:hypothetical protein
MQPFSFIRRAVLASFIAATLAACNSTVDPQSNALYTSGVFVINSGNFFDNNGSLSWLTRDSKTAQTDLFQARNRRPLTGGLSDYVEVGNRGLILVDNSSAGLDKIEIVSTDSLRSIATLAAPDIENPRHAVRISDTKAYVSCWGATGSSVFYVNPGYIAVIDLTTNKITKKIALQKGAESILVIGTEAYVGGEGGDNLVQVIDTQTDALKTTINVGGNTDLLQRDASGKIWTFVGKNAVRIDPTTKAVDARLLVGNDARKSPGTLTPSANGLSFYFTYTFYDAADNYKRKGELYTFTVAEAVAALSANANGAAIATTKPLVSRVFSGLGFDARSNTLYTGYSPSLKQAGYVFRYQPTGQLIDSVKVEIGPSGFVFK